MGACPERAVRCKYTGPCSKASTFMSTTPNPEASLTSQLAAVSRRSDRQVRVYSHSALFYWWPVWAVGFLMALLTLVTNERMAIVPGRTAIIRGAKVTYPTDNGGEVSIGGSRDVLVLPEGAQ